jgi:DinB superfamily
MPLIDGLLQELEQEAQTTRRVLERVPDDQLTWRPHEKARTLGELALHVAMVHGGVSKSKPVSVASAAARSRNGAGREEARMPSSGRNGNTGPRPDAPPQGTKTRKPTSSANGISWTAPSNSRETKTSSPT